MDFEKETEAKTITENQIDTSTTETEEVKFDNLPRFEDLLKSEQEIAPKQELKGLQQVENNSLSQDRTFKSKQDEKKLFVKKRFKILTGVYISIVALLFGFVIFNTATLAILNKNINSNTTTINAENQIVTEFSKQVTPEDPSGAPIQVTLNEPRDYSDDKKELTFFDKLTILFRNIFG